MSTGTDNRVLRTVQRRGTAAPQPGVVHGWPERVLFAFVLLTVALFYLMEDGKTNNFPTYFLLIGATCLAPRLWRERAGLTRVEIAALALMGYFALSTAWSVPGEWFAAVTAITLLSAFLFMTTHCLVAMPRAFDLLLLTLLLAATVSGLISSGSHLLEYGAGSLDARLDGWGRLRNSVVAGFAYGFAGCVAFVLFALRPRECWWCLPLIALFALCVTLTSTRAAWVGLIAAAVMVAGIRLRLTMKHLLAGWAGVMALAATALMIAQYVKPGWFYGGLRRGISHRDEIWGGVLQYVAEAPVFGFGLFADFGVYNEPIGTTYIHPHSIYFAALYYGGIVGLFLLGALAAVAIAAHRQLHRDQRHAISFVLLTFSLVALMFDGDVLLKKVDFIWIVFWIPIALAVFAERTRTVPVIEEGDS